MFAFSHPTHTHTCTKFRKQKRKQDSWWLKRLVFRVDLTVSIEFCNIFSMKW